MPASAPAEFFKIHLGLDVLPIVLGTGGDVRKAQPLEQLANRALAHPHAEAFGDGCLRIATPPARHALAPRCLGPGVRLR